VEILGLEALEIYYDKIKVIDGVTLSMHEGDVVTMLGSNGAGKSTLLKVISGILFCDFGQISFYGRRIENMDPNRIVKLRKRKPLDGGLHHKRQEEAEGKDGLCF
jgi:branched-chain amino acid transport system ATP-binding protein